MGYQQNNNGSRGDFGNRNSYGNKQFEDKSFIPQAIVVDSFYKDNGSTIKQELFDETASKIANSFIGQNRRGSDIGITSTQLRRIFDEVKRFEQILSVSPDQWEVQYPYIRMIKSKVAYTVARAAKDKADEAGLYKNLEKFISSCIDLVKTNKDYEVFVSLFEAVYGFYYEKAPKSAK